jgi:hypothetical protein
VSSSFSLVYFAAERRKIRTRAQSVYLVSLCFLHPRHGSHHLCSAPRHCQLRAGPSLLPAVPVLAALLPLHQISMAGCTDQSALCPS